MAVGDVRKASERWSGSWGGWSDARGKLVREEALRRTRKVAEEVERVRNEVDA